ncbi:plantaricin C family lantibiotic [Streptomyces phyllanthi]|uniref:Plantaricin C family lantibiotic n=1 Tax=Streptomyces phyllanthi TaxID=1803180 RepID=A0A5N8WAI1_9ACTN|nr:plantaricin C family lantibiotic [Streptomyces phyllanthi]MPY43135.1 plantaricin C family lantibiotic [Streptomyces phyllanthi]
MAHKQETSDPAVSVLEQIEDQSVNFNGGAVAGISTWLGNSGQFCTVTVECINWCR